MAGVPAVLAVLTMFGGDPPPEDLDTSWPPVLVAGVLVLVFLAIVAVVVVVRQARGVARNGGRRPR
jgi:hypothetical protein